MIPKRIHAFWGGPEMPEHLQAYLQSWRDMHPDWKFTLWTPGTIPPLRNQDMFDHPEVWSPVSNPWQWKSDLARYEILYDVGGVYVDCDLEPLRPIDDLIGSEFIAREDGHFVNNAFMGVAPRSRWGEAIFNGLRASAMTKPDERCNRQVGAWYLTRLIKRHREVKILPREVVYPYHWSKLHRGTEDFSGAYTVHHWANKRSQQGS